MRLSISKIKAFKSCRRLYDLRYNEKLYPVQKAEALEIGSNYHKILEAMYNNPEDVSPFEEGDFSKENAMAHAYAKYIYPKFKVTAAEKWLEYELPGGDKFVGIADGIAEDGALVEHKTVGSEITEQYEYNLLWDEQILAYMLMTGARHVWYTVCRKPTIRQKQNESAKEFYERMIAWYDTDTDSKIRLIKVERTDEEVEAFKHELYQIAIEIKMADNYYRNTCHCNMYGRRCEYSGVCLHYDPNMDYIDFVKKEDEYGNTDSENG